MSIVPKLCGISVCDLSSSFDCGQVHLPKCYNPLSVMQALWAETMGDVDLQNKTIAFASHRIIKCGNFRNGSNPGQCISTHASFLLTHQSRTPD